MIPIYPAIQANCAFSITPSDTVDVIGDVANTALASHVFLHNPGAGVTVRVMPSAMSSSATAVTIYVPQGATFPLAVRRVYATTPTTAAGAFIGIYSK